MHLTWRGHSCFEVETAGKTFLIDPFLEASDASPRGLEPDVVLVTHGHGDHVGSAAEFDSPVVAIPEIAHRLSELGCRTVDMNIGGTVSFGEAMVHMTMAFHSSSMEGYEVYGGMPAGYVIEGDCSVYHAGDTSLFRDMVTIGDMLEPDVALLPIGDHYTMGPRSAAVAAEWLGVEVAIPMHFDTFPAIEQSADDFVSMLPGDVDGAVLKPGETFERGV
ncbi:MAG: hypothetical protein MAG715_01361 [Methanonatronarchaeales archaeon]|nr:hypothetical protein [Methanonatronarchaeales archaeon]